MQTPFQLFGVGPQQIVAQIGVMPIKRDEKRAYARILTQFPGRKAKFYKEPYMPRANRYILPGYIYHLTQRCHNRKFLLRFRLDREKIRPLKAALKAKKSLPDLG
jgi:hypothetical protein